jgi:uncharacterized protein YkwD
MYRLAAPTLAVALLVLAALIAFVVVIDPFAKPNQQHAVYSQPPGDARVGLQSFAAFGLFGWPAPSPTPLPTEPPVADAGAAAEVSSLPANSAPPVPASEDNPPAATEYQDYEMASAVLASVNSARAAQGIAALSANDALTGAAQSYAQLLAQLHTLAHDAGGGLLTRVQAAGYPGDPFLGEALWEGWGQYGPGGVVNDWLNSPPHRDILLTTTYAEAGVACFVEESNGAKNTRCVLDVAG